MASLTFDIPTKIATVGIADTDISCQEVLDQFRDFEDTPEAMGFPKMVEAAGKVDLAGGTQTVITVTLLDDWKLKFADRAGPSTIQCLVFGGNLVGKDGVGAESFPLEPATFVFASIAQATTGALLGSLAPEFQGGIWIDAGGTAGTAFPTGTPSQPVSNIADALIIANTYGIKTLFLESDIAVSDDVSGFHLQSKGGLHTATFSGAVTSNTTMTDLKIDGTLNGILYGQRIHFEDGVNDICGEIHDCEIDGTMTIVPPIFTLIDGSSGAVGLTTAIVDGQGLSGLTVQFRRYAGGVEIKGFVTGDEASVDLVPGKLTINADVTGGTFKVRGTGEPIENYGTVDTLDEDGFNPSSVDSIRARKLLSNRQELVNTGSDTRMRTWDDDGTTILEENIITKDDDTDADLSEGVTKRGVSQ